MPGGHLGGPTANRHYDGGWQWLNTGLDGSWLSYAEMRAVPRLQCFTVTPHFEPTYLALCEACFSRLNSKVRRMNHQKELRVRATTTDAAPAQMPVVAVSVRLSEDNLWCTVNW